MALREWREINRLSLDAAAKRLGAANGTVVWRWENGVAIPRRGQMVRIYVETRGQVDPNSFYDLPALDWSSIAVAEPELFTRGAA